jgi:hypothetical protein
MKKEREVRGGLKVLGRLPSSINGNPRYSLNVGGLDCCTAPDSGLAYSITNYDGKEVIAMVSPHYGRMTIRSVKTVEPVA